MRVDLRQRRLQQGPLEAAAGGLGRADREVLARGLTHLLDEFLVVVRMDLEEVAGGGRRTESRVGDDLCGDAVHRGAQSVGDRPVHGAGDQRVHELQLAAVRLAVGRVRLGEDAGRAQEFGAAHRLCGTHRREAGHQVHGDAGAEDGRGPGEPGGLGRGPPAGPPGHGRGPIGSGRAVRRRTTRPVPGCLHLGEEFDRLVGLPPVTAHTSRQNGASACAPTVARVSPAAASGVSAVSVVSGRRAAAAIVSRWRSLSPETSPGRRATTTRTRSSSRRSQKAASQWRVSWSAQCASSMSRTSGHSRLASRETAATSPSHTPCGSAWRSPGSVIPRAGRRPRTSRPGTRAPPPASVRRARAAATAVRH